MGSGSMMEADEKSRDTSPVMVPQLTKRQKLSRNCKRWWWAWLIAVLLLILVIVLAVIFGAIPKIAQDKLNDSTLELHSFNIENPTPKKFTVSMNATINTGGGVASHAKLEPMDVALFLEGKEPIEPFMTIPVPGTDGGEYVDIIKENYEVNIADMSALDGFAAYLMESETMRVAMRGRTKLHLGKLKMNVDYNEVVTMKGLNHLKGMAIKSYDIISNNPKANMGGMVLIPNPSPILLEMGNVGLKIAVEGTDMGVGVIPNLTLRPGNHEYKFTALIKEDKLLNLAMAAGQKKALTIGSNGTEASGQKISWLSKPLEKMESTVPFDVEVK